MNQQTLNLLGINTLSGQPESWWRKCQSLNSCLWNWTPTRAWDEGGRGGRLGSKECKVLSTYGRVALNKSRERHFSFSANYRLELLDTFFRTTKNQERNLAYVQRARQNVYIKFSRGSETENSCGMLLCTPNRHSYLSRTTTSQKHI